METTKVDLNPITIQSDYLSGAAALRQFYQYPFPAGDYLPILQDKARESIDRETLADELQRQNRHLPGAELTLSRIDLLRRPDSFTVTTGHQLVMMGGPMYTIYKIAHAIRLAEAIQKRQPDYHIVPVFWMATEDHDWEEVNHFYPSFAEKRVYPGRFRGPVGRHTLAQGIRETLAGVVPEELAAFFEPGKKYAEAFREFIHHLFGFTGLVIVDADSPVLKRLFLPAMRRELTGEGMISHIQATDAELETRGYKQQIYSRDINLFYLGEGGRDLITGEADGGFSLKDQDRSWSREELLAILEAHPEHFSPNVAARPLYQESILPNLAYIGGWAEMSYWMQLKQAFDAAGVNFPLLVPRMSATLVTQAQAADLAELGMDAEQLARPLHELNEWYLMRHWSDAELNAATDQVGEAFDDLIAYLETLDPTLAISMRAEKAKTRKTLEKLEKKVHKSIRNRHPAPYRAIEALKGAISPDHRQQQRILNLTAFSEFQPKRLVEIILQECRPETYQEQWIILP